MLSAEQDPPSTSSYNNVSALKIDGSPKSSSSSDKAKSKAKAVFSSTPAPAPEAAAADLDDDNYPPTFSIRDYVHTSRLKNIQTSWLFSNKSLQVCLRHGVKDLLPPFEPPESVRKLCHLTQGARSDQVDCQLKDKETTKEVGSPEHGNEDGEIHLFKSESHNKTCEPVVESTYQTQTPLQEQEKLPIPIVCSSLSEFDNASGSEGVQVASTLVSHDAQSERESLPSKEVHCSPQEAAHSTFSGALVLVDNSHLRCPSEKNDITVESSGKKCRLILKLGPVSDPSRTDQDITSIATAVSDPMASKVCPVCKNFSSSSNTTLNAHIDQCLAVESSSKSAMDVTTLTKHRIKPRKKRSMVDICATAPRCTLEELDRRNGSNWATDTCLPNAESDVSAQGKRQRMSHVDVEDDDGEEASVYFDSNGTKLRILSKFGDASTSTAGEDSRSRKNMKNDKESKVPFDKKKSFGPKHSKHLKGKPRNKTLSSLNSSKIYETPEMKSKSGEKEECLSQLPKDRKEINRNEPRSLRQWVCSKRTGLLKRVGSKDGREVLGHPSSMIRNPLIESDGIGLANASLEGSHILQASTVISSSKGKDVERPFREVQAKDSWTKSCKAPPENELNCLANKNTSSQSSGCKLKLPRSPGKFTSSPRSKRIEVVARNSDGSARMRMNPLEYHKKLLVKGKRFSTLSDGISVESFSDFMSKDSEKRSPSMKSHMHRSTAEMDGQFGGVPSNIEGQHGCMRDCTENIHGRFNKQGEIDKSDDSSDMMIPEPEEFSDPKSFGRSGALKPRLNRDTAGFPRRKKGIASKTSPTQPDLCDLDRVGVGCASFPGELHFHHSQYSKNLTVKIGGTETGGQKVSFRKETVIGNFSKKGDERPNSILSDSLVSEPQRLANPFDMQQSSLQSIEEHEGLACGAEAMMPLMKQILVEDQHDRNEVCNAVGGNTYMVSEVNSTVEGLFFSEGQHQRQGSGTAHFSMAPRLFLPTPRNMGSDDHPESSSINSSKIFSSQDSHQIADRDSSGSPVSATSIVSNLTVARPPDSKYSETVSAVKLPEVNVKYTPGLSSGCIEPRVLDAITLPPMFSATGAAGVDLDGECPAATTTTTREASLKFKSDQPCCCSRKDSFSLGASVVYQDLPFLEQRNATSVMPAKGKQMAYTKVRPEMFMSCSDSRSSDATTPVFGSPSSPFSRKPSSGAAQKLRNGVDFSPACLSSQVHDVKPSSNPVLRLMGKNLMVVNKGEEVPVQLSQPPNMSANNLPSIAYSDLLRFSTGSISNQDHLSSYHVVPEDYTIFSRDSCFPSQTRYSDVNQSGGLRSSSNFKTRQTQPKQLAGNDNNVHMRGLAGSSLLKHGFRERIDLPAEHKRSLTWLDSFPCNLERGDPTREVIVIDDSPENEAEPNKRHAKHTKEFKGSVPSPVGVLPPAGCSILRQMNGFPCYASANPFSQMEPPFGSKASYLVSQPRGPNISQWGGISESSSLSLQSPFVSTPSTTNAASQPWFDQVRAKNMASSNSKLMNQFVSNEVFCKFV